VARQITRFTATSSHACGLRGRAANARKAAELLWAPALLTWGYPHSPVSAKYDAIGLTYAATRIPDPRIARAIDEALGDARTVLNVGAGAGAYEPPDRRVVAVEPSRTMLAQRRTDGRAVQAIAEALPFEDRSFDAVMGVLTIHHWKNQRRGLAEAVRVARDRIGFLSFDTKVGGFWLTEEYFPAIARLDRERIPSIERVADALGTRDVRVIEIPADCTDGFTGAYWARPEVYLDRSATTNMSTFILIPEGERDAGVKRLADDLASGRWDERFGHLRTTGSLDIGYRLVVGRHSP
jgi:SAM-dependent methyltransferase